MPRMVRGFETGDPADGGNRLEQRVDPADRR
jgi:hypothetical protein